MSLLRELNGVIILSGLIAFQYELPFLRVISTGVLFKMILDVFLDRDTELNEAFFNLDGGYLVKVFVTTLAILSLEGQRSSSR